MEPTTNLYHTDDGLSLSSVVNRITFITIISIASCCSRDAMFAATQATLLIAVNNTINWGVNINFPKLSCKKFTKIPDSLFRT